MLYRAPSCGLTYETPGPHSKARLNVSLSPSPPFATADRPDRVAQCPRRAPPRGRARPPSPGLALLPHPPRHPARAQVSAARPVTTPGAGRRNIQKELVTTRTHSTPHLPLYPGADIITCGVPQHIVSMALNPVCSACGRCGPAARRASSRCWCSRSPPPPPRCVVGPTRPSPSASHTRPCQLLKKPLTSLALSTPMYAAVASIRGLVSSYPPAVLT